MKSLSVLSICTLCAVFAVPAIGDSTVRLTIPGAQTPVTTVLSNLAKVTDTTILTDNTVTGSVGPTALEAANVGAMLTKLESLDTGLSWRKVYLPQDAPLPSGETLSREVRSLETLPPTGLVVASPTESITVTHQTNAPAAPPAGMQAVYLVTDEQVRAQHQETAAAPPLSPQASPVTQAATGMQNVADTFGSMTADEQRQALPQMFQQFQRIMQSMDPSVRGDLGQMFRQWQGQNGPQDQGAGQ
jgi:hypothetical protein